jgi:hypothetical protein
MATKKQTVKVCDVCKHEVVDSGEMWIGGHSHAGWFAIEKHGGPTDLMSLREQKYWDVCSIECLTKLAASFAEIKSI